MPMTATRQKKAKRNKFEDNPDVTVRASIQATPLRRSVIRIFDNKVERASREKSIRFGLIILTR
jgi:hypothetical protein